MSNFSNTFQCYLQGYCGDELEPRQVQRQQLLRAFTLGVYHRVTAKPPLMRSVDVVAELRQMRDAATSKPAMAKPITTNLTVCDVVLKAVDPKNPIAAIKGVREVAYLSLSEAKELVDRVKAGAFEIVLAHVASDFAANAAAVLRGYGCTVEVI